MELSTPSIVMTVGAGAVDPRAHRIEQTREIHDLGFARGVLEHRGALGERAAIIRFSVPVTVTMSMTMRAPFGASPCAAM